MAELIYHDPSDRTGRSPFDRAVRNLAADGEVIIACPYIRPDYLEDLVEPASDWYLLTDVEEWLGIHTRTKRGGGIHEFLTEHRDRVRHVGDLHAKVVIGGDRALVGSANLTTKGLTRRTEMAVLLDDGETVNELTEWYESLWSLYDPPELEEVEAYLESAASTPSPARTRSGASLSSSGSPGTASLGDSSGAETAVDGERTESHADLVQRVSRAPGPEWIDAYFDLFDELIAETGLSNEDSRLVSSLPGAGTIPVTVNNRYVLVAFRGERSRTEFLLPACEGVESHLDRADRVGRFDSIYDEDESETPWFVGFDGSPVRVLDDEFKTLWLDGVATEMARADTSPYKRHHEPAVYEAALDRTYRETVIREAFTR